MRRFGTALGLALVLSAALAGEADAATIERTYNVGNEPFGVTIDPADGRIYVANSDRGSSNPGFLSVVDPAVSCSPSLPCVTTIAMASPPTMSALDRGLGRLFVTTANRTLTFVDIATRSVVNTVPNAGGLGVAVDEANHTVYAAAVTSLSMVDGLTGAVLHTAPAGLNDQWWAVALDATARRVYVTNLDTGGAPSLVILSADDLSPIDEVPLPEVPRLALAVDAARQLVYVGGFSGAGRLYVVDANTRVIAATVDLQAGASVPFSATLVTAEDRLYLSQTSTFGPNSLVILDLATSTSCSGYRCRGSRARQPFTRTAGCMSLASAPISSLPCSSPTQRP
jgi:DNA-binding beta-propeller fold protein YncE